MKSNILALLLLTFTTLTLLGCKDSNIADERYLSGYPEGALIKEPMFIDDISLRGKIKSFSDSRRTKHSISETITNQFGYQETSLFYTKISHFRVLGIIENNLPEEFSDLYDFSLVLGWGPMSKNSKIRDLKITGDMNGGYTSVSYTHLTLPTILRVYFSDVDDTSDKYIKKNHMVT